MYVYAFLLILVNVILSAISNIVTFHYVKSHACRLMYNTFALSIEFLFILLLSYNRSP